MFSLIDCFVYFTNDNEIHWCSRWVWHCCHCSDHFDNSSKLVTHSAVHNTHPDSNDQDLCNACGIAYNVHLRDMTKPNQTNIKVEIVEVGEDEGYNFDKEYDVDDVECELLNLEKEHLMEEKLFTNIFICNHCFLYFTTKHSLKIHMRKSHIHLYGLVEHYKCDLCNNSKMYKRGQDIRKHMRLHHDEEVDDVSRFVNKRSIEESKVAMNSTTSYECTPCEKTYARKQDIVKHMRYVHNKQNINLKQYRGNTKILLKDFPKYKTKTRVIYKCDVCKDIHINPVHLINHMKREHELDIDASNLVAQSELVFGCTFCNEDDFLSLEILKVHCEESHNYQVHIYLCPECSIFFIYGGNMVKHMKEMHAVENFSNRDLVQTIVKKGKVKSGKLGQDSRVYSCKFCAEKFKLKCDVVSHLLGVHNASSKEYLVLDEKDLTPQHDVDIDNMACFLCNQPFENDMNALWNHMFSKHATSVPFQCPLCLALLYRKRDVLKHMGEKHGIEVVIEDNEKMEMLKQKCRVYVDGVLKYQCPECTVYLNSFSSLKTHMFTHTGEKPIVCDQCSKQFRTVSQLKVHIVSVHENVRKYGCEYCGHAFACSSNLQQHIRIHTGEKPYVCELCGNRYAQSASLYSHKLTHAQNRCHVCAECGRAFHRVTRLRQHMKIHTGDRPPRSHLCDICHKGFRTNSEMKRHQQIHTSVRSYVCETCGAGFTVRKYLLQHYKIHRERPEDLGQQFSIETITDLGYDV